MRETWTSEFNVALPATAAIGLFTPEGERAWIPGWDPVYATGETSETPATVFTTAAGGIETIWVIIEIDRAGGTAAYARITRGRHAGTVRVRCTNVSPGSSAVGLSYDMSLLPDADPAVLKEYAPAQFQARAAELAGLIEAFLRGQR